MPHDPHTAARAWADGIATPGQRFESQEALLDATIELAEASARNGGGPFGAIIANEGLEVVAIGWNAVIEQHDSTAHAEIQALRRAQGHLATHDLATAEGAPYTLYTSCAPCIQCFGAIYWSGLSEVVSAATAEAAEALGFQEGPVTDALWQAAKADKGIEHRQEAPTEQPPDQPFETYSALGGELY